MDSATEQTQADLLLLARLLHQKPALYGQLLRQHGSPAEIIANAQRLAKAHARLLAKRRLRQLADKDAAWAAEPGHRLLPYTSVDYPSRLKGIFDPPLLLYVVAAPEAALGQEPMVSIVGSRKATPYGKGQAGLLAEGLAALGVPVVSGLAYGIDAAAHKGSLKGGGPTLAVLGSGPDIIYPSGHAQLAARIVAEGGMLLSEFPPGVAPYPGNFPKRNRILVGMSLATVVVEAGLRSGSLVSANLALAEGREVMAVPGLVSNPLTRGCHQLIRDGATLVEGVEDILQALGLTPTAASGSQAQAATGPAAGLLALLAEAPRTLDELIALTGAPYNELLATLTNLEIEGAIQSDAGRYHHLRG